MLLTGLVRPAAGEPELVILVRHAEKAALPLSDPGLSDAGRARARALADALADAGIGAIFTTQLRRTRETAAVLAERSGVTPIAIESGPGASEAHVAAVVAAVRDQRGRVLVVGHSNSVSRIATALGAGSLPDLCDSSYGHALVLVPGRHGPALLRLRYGAPDPPSGEDCL